MKIWWGFVIHIIIAPRGIEMRDIRVIGMLVYIFLWKFVSGFDFERCLLDRKDIRIVYEAVIPMEEIIKRDIMKLDLVLINISIIMSLEKNPEVNGSPIRVILDSPSIEDVKGDIFVFVSIIRMSW